MCVLWPHVDGCLTMLFEKKTPTNKIMEEYANNSNFLIGYFSIFNNLLPISACANVWFCMHFQTEENENPRGLSSWTLSPPQWKGYFKSN